jgi:hypothetical protein
MKLPNAERAVVDVKKLRDYCLNLHHPRGRHKARVFASSLGIVAADAEMLRRELLAAAVSEDVLLIDTDEYGQRYQLDLTLTRNNRKARVRSSWIVRRGEDFPRLTSCYIL